MKNFTITCIGWYWKTDDRGSDTGVSEEAEKYHGEGLIVGYAASDDRFIYIAVLTDENDMPVYKDDLIKNGTFRTSDKYVYGLRDGVDIF